MKLHVFSGRFLLLVALLLPCLLRADELGVAIIKTDGSVHHVELSDIERIDILSNTLIINTLQNKNPEYSYSDINRIDIGVSRSGDTTSIEKHISDGSIAVWPTLAEESVNVAGAPVGTRIMVYTPEGRVVASAIATGNTSSINVSALSSGLYIVSIGKYSVKIVKR